MIDLHSHTVRCDHAEGTPDEYAEAAVRAGLRCFGQSCHSPWMIQRPHRKLAMREHEVDAYIADILALRERFAGRIDILLGMEVDWHERGAAQRIRETAEKHPFDYLIGSVHHLPQCDKEQPAIHGFLFRDGVDEEAIWSEYFRTVGEMVRAELIDIVAHIDLPKLKTTLPLEAWLPLAEPAIEALADVNAAGRATAFEINTSGRDKNVESFFPEEPFVRQLREAGVPVAFGSDAHAPEHVARYFDEGFAMARRCGYEEMIYFVEREPRFEPIPGE